MAGLDSVRYRIAVSSCSCGINPSVKMQRDLLRADWSSGKSGTRHNSVRGEQITP